MLFVEHHAEHQNAPARGPLEQLASDGDSGGGAEQHVEHDQIRIRGIDERARFRRLGGFAHHLEIGLRGEQGPQTFAEQSMVVDESHSIAHGASP